MHCAYHIPAKADIPKEKSLCEIQLEAKPSYHYSLESSLFHFPATGKTMVTITYCVV
jgi:hypothetical protein